MGQAKFGIVDKNRGYSGDFAFVTGPATISINEADIPHISNVFVSAKDPYKRGWNDLYVGKPSSSIRVEYKGTPLMLELEWKGTLPNGTGLITW